ncbi:Type 1 glutamine amidotransferase-like domain-containing protein [Arthrobacter sp. EH-1B-1]|uniref:Type 1 glutamine amidotransferase-like domain-containing protein n=1 Tax=Arthrobacter vasquezii TaxID=2977629 RepID=A0ABT6CXG5_9MICC|nr:Type 1 glutamine amidotransferase-like domain-containing protein [Arthrobacter vasquezii]MDF9278600.1 Type 1 glutamine amidotransferase-like domain-containing protein [Arthrobacter vasquezii]
MKLLLTSAGVTNPTIFAALEELIGKPISESNALCIPTAQYGHPWVGPGIKAWEFISGRSENPMVDLGWESVGVLELTALPSIDEERWKPLVLETDVLLAAGGDALYLNHWVQQSGLADMFPSLTKTVWVGMSAGSMVMTPQIGREFVGWKSMTGDDSTLGVVPFSICPHLAPDGAPGNSLAAAEKWAGGIQQPSYAIDDQTAISVTDDAVDVLTEGIWRYFPK